MFSKALSPTSRAISSTMAPFLLSNSSGGVSSDVMSSTGDLVISYSFIYTFTANNTYSGGTTLGNGPFTHFRDRQ